MPSAVINKVIKKCNISEEEAEKKWKQAKEIAKKEDQTDKYDYIMGIFKKSLGKDCINKLDWKTNECIINRILRYL